MAKISQLQVLVTPWGITKLGYSEKKYLAIGVSKKCLALYRPLGILRIKIDKSTCQLVTFGHR
jgi:hypothetical protein